MEKATIIVGEEYAVRENPSARSPFQHIKILQHIRHNKWKAQWIDPNPGLVDYLESAQILVPWKERKPFLLDGEDAAHLACINKEHGYQAKSLVTQAVQQVFESVSDDIEFYHHELAGSPEAFSRVRARANDKDVANPIGAYTDRRGRTHWPFTPTLELARKFCAAEPSTVLIGIEATERQSQ